MYRRKVMRRERRVPSTTQEFQNRDVNGSGTEEDHWLGYRTEQKYKREAWNETDQRIKQQRQNDEQQAISEHRGVSSKSWQKKPCELCNRKSGVDQEVSHRISAHAKQRVSDDQLVPRMLHQDTGKTDHGK